MLGEKYQELRKDVQFELGELVVIRKHDGDKLAYPWSPPYRVIAIHRDGTTATLRHILFDKTKDNIHISNCRKINIPVNETQEREWSKNLLEGLPAETRKRALRQLGEEFEAVRLKRHIVAGGESDVPSSNSVQSDD
jgi:hypothetical protein